MLESLRCWAKDRKALASKAAKAMWVKRKADAMKQAKGFTLMELLVVISIIMILVGLLLPVLSYVRRSANVARIQGDLQTIATALEAYKQDFGDYPRPSLTDSSQTRGAVTLCNALLSPGPQGVANDINTIGDGADGYGFRARRTTVSRPTGAFDAGGNPIMVFDHYVWHGKVYGPYISPDSFTASATDCTGYLMRRTTPVAYYASKPASNTTAANSFLADTTALPVPMWNIHDNLQWVPASLAQQIFGANADGSQGVNGVTSKFVLVTCKEDQQSWTASNTVSVNP